MGDARALGAEALGTFWLVLGGCGSAVLAAKFGGDGNPLGIGLVGVALAFGLTVLTGAHVTRVLFDGRRAVGAVLVTPSHPAGRGQGGRFGDPHQFEGEVAVGALASAHVPARYK